MPFTAVLSIVPQTARAVDEVCTRGQAQLAGPIDLALVFFSPHHAEYAALIGETIRKRLAPRCLLGCSGEGIIGNDQEIEQRPAVSLWLGRWSRPVELEAFHLVQERTPDGVSLLGWPDGLVGAVPRRSAMLLLGDPYTFPVDLLLEQVNTDYPGLRVLGGMCSGGGGPGESRLLIDGWVVQAGAVGVLLQGELGLRSIVSQGCRPIGRHLVITRAEDNIIRELGGRPPLEQLQQLWQELSPEEQQLLQRGLHIGRVINEYQGEFQRGDFLVRNVLGIDRESGALAITDWVRVGQTVQFHVRDARTADEDLRALLQLDLSAHEKRPTAALVFSCNGRGTRLFPEPHHDARTIRAEAGEIPLAGFFAAGELGPVGGQNFIHGFTASVVLFED
ncbi:MAG TPA: FIST N-terminal domain-containing protein [Gemmataceae bacterium]|nr:FIST N-terminal domain-containing protein [Gemmataceae bacterium]